jgi:RNA polymerase sigma-70 factor (ECF subfamily)
VAHDPLRHLLEAAQEGDDTALRALIEATSPSVRRLCRALGSEDTADDLAQETYLRAMRAIGDYRGEAPVRAWLLAIARNVCVDDVRRRTRDRRVVERVAQQPVGEATGPTPVGDLLASVDPDRLEAFVLTQIVGLSYAEAAHLLGCPIGTIRSRVARARVELAAAVEGAVLVIR